MEQKVEGETITASGMLLLVSGNLQPPATWFVKEHSFRACSDGTLSTAGEVLPATSARQLLR